jgi:antitoxin component of MazEF toxin-antitoxin module
VLTIDNSIVIKRSEKKKHLTTKERIAAFRDTMKPVQISETDWGKPQGKEIW